MAVTCPACGTVDTGTYCSGCGTVLPSKDGRTWLTFADSFFKFRDLRRYLRTYGHMLASPTRNTLALSQEGNLGKALQFLQTSVFIYTLAVVSKLITGGLIVSQLITPLLLLVAMGSFSAMFYWLARRKSPRPHSGRDFLILCSYSVGFTLPVAGAVQAFQLKALTPWRLLALAIAVIIVAIPLYVYILRVWGQFWELPKRKVFLYLVIVALVQMVVAIPASFAWISKRPPPVVRRANTSLAVIDQLSSWDSQFYEASRLINEANFSAFNAQAESIGQSGSSVRMRFASVPNDLEDGKYIFDVLGETGDAAVAWADVVKTDPLPFEGTPEEVVRKGSTLANAVTHFVEALNKLSRAMKFPEVVLPS